MVIQVALRNKAKEYATILPANPEYLTLSNNFGESDMQLTGSSSEMLVNLVNSGLLPKDTRIATRKDLEKTIKRVSDFLSEVYVDCGFNLDSRDDEYTINHDYAQVLAEDLKAVGIRLRNAKLIPYNLLTKKFRLSEEGKDTAKGLILDTQDFKWDCEPSDSGLFGAGFEGNGYWGCRDGDLADPYLDGRVVVISGEATSRKFLDEYASKFKASLRKE